ncbi:MAG: hypothetical protein NVS3B20_02000 [Polyangiales bacterium]
MNAVQSDVIDVCDFDPTEQPLRRRVAHDRGERSPGGGAVQVRNRGHGQRCGENTQKPKPRGKSERYAPGETPSAGTCTFRSVTVFTVRWRRLWGWPVLFRFLRNARSTLVRREIGAKIVVWVRSSKGKGALWETDAVQWRASVGL